ncbi:MAG: hypothetical protein H0U74_11600 [Bradymonadaceae bacterium]|nr:hypothetical protein [Lujinxingiaceae bacterium]
MADFLVVFGERSWVGQRGLFKRFAASVMVSNRTPHHVLHVGFRPAPRPYPGEFGCLDNLAVAWVGHWRNRAQMRRDLGLAIEASSLETMVAAFRNYGESAFSRMRGIVTAVVWDMESGVLNAFRDKIGLAPLVYAPGRGAHQGVALSTDPEWLGAWMGERPEVNASRLRAFLSGSTDQGYDDFIVGMERVLPGERVRWQPGSVGPKRRFYWQPDTTPLGPADDLPQRLVDGLRDFYDTLEARPRVVAMSGGLDSPALAALESHWGGYSPERPLNVVSMVAPGLPRSDESAQISEIEAALPIRVHPYAIDERWPLQSLAFYARQLHAGPHFHPEEYYVDGYHRWIGERFGPVDLLSGHGADDALWCSAPYYLRSLARTRRLGELARAVRHAGAGFVAREMMGWGLESLGVRDELRRALAPLRAWGAGGHPSNRAMPWRQPERWVRQPHGEQPAQHTAWSAPGANWGEVRLGRLRTWKWELVCRTLQREARRNSVNIEYPMLDDRLWELCLRIEPQQLAAGGRQKALLREAMTGWLPNAVVQRGKHGGFDAVVEKALTRCEAARIEALFDASRLAQMEVIDSKRFLDVYRSYRLATLGVERPFLGSLALWQTIAAEVWLGWLQKS